MEPGLAELTGRELTDPGYCTRVQNFTVGRFGYGSVRFIGETDVRWLDLNQIVKFRRHEIVVYEDETIKPVVGKGLNKAAEVALVLQKTASIEKLKLSAENQEAEFISFDPHKKEWKFSVQHFSRFGLSDDEDDDVMMDDADVDVREQVTMNDSDGSDLDEDRLLTDPRLLSHSLPSHLGLDPVRMKEMRMVMFSTEEEDDDEELDNLNGTFSHHRPLLGSKTVQRSSPLAIRKTPLALLEYNPGGFASSPNGSILLAQQNKGLPLTVTKVQGFKLEIKETPVTKSFSKNIVDAGLLMGIIERQLEVQGLSSSARVMLMHQVFVWELIKVLFSSKESSLDADVAALPLIRRAEFSVLLQESVCHRVQDEISSLSDSKDLQQLFLLLTGRQIDSAVELSASRGDVRLACLLSQAGGSTVNRMDIDRQLGLWKNNSLDFSFIEKDRIRLFELLAGNIHGALGEMNIDWKRFLGLLMWYHLSPASDLTSIFQTYQRLLEDGRAPYPVPVYIDEELVKDGVCWTPGNRFDIAYYLMILHSNEERDFTKSSMLKTLFSAFASTHDPLDHHMIWHQRAVLEAVGTFSSDDLHVLDMGFVSQLLTLGHCHWAIYVVLHMSRCDDYPYLQASVIREIVFQYCETWSAQENQRKFIVELGVPSAWLHEALAVYHAYYGNSFKALEHYLGCAFWQKAHSTFITSVAHSLFMSGKQSEILRLATSMEDHKSEIENWDLGAGIFITFYSLKSSLKEDEDTMSELVSLQDKNDECRKFFSRLKGSLAFWDNRLPIDARTVYAKMAEEISDLLVADSGEGSSTEVKLECFNTIFDSPVPQDLLSSHLQSAISHFTLHLTEAVS
ncbi:hypothetical protein L1987_22835 [Smallanthus sonchifolius]|uniref:Uncharacterized protein n=1 Tax=Smallanthus sonchifolius TaxID=185202 RepID=A0ACB9IFS6_9ASTR|nr:hypothetical protein L1987_22835 [Smallanthus sonchifolius]